MDWFWISNTIIPLAAMATGLVCMTGVYRLASKWIDRKTASGLSGGSGDAVLERLDQIQAELEHIRNDQTVQLEEMNERLDFAERLLANPENRPGPGS